MQGQAQDQAGPPGGEVGEEEGEEGGAATSDLCLSLDESSPMAAVAAQLTNAFNLLPETECCGLYAAKALINHSCDPNCVIEWHDDSATLRVVATRDISAGTEVSHCYICLDDYPTLAERRAVLRQQHGFTCVCQRCAEEALQEAGPASAPRGRRKA